GEAGHCGHQQAECDRPEGDAVGAPGQARAGRRVAALARRRADAGLAARDGLALRATRHQDGLAPVALLVLRAAETVVPARVRERLGPVWDLYRRRLEAQVLD